jgi:hypothetical protein
MTNATTEATKLSLMVEISAKAVDFIERRQTRRFMQEALSSAYVAWREENDIHFRIERDSEEWKNMMAATSSEYEDLENAKREETNSEKRLRTAVFKFQSIIDDEKRKDAGLDPVDVDGRLINAELYAQLHP